MSRFKSKAESMFELKVQYYMKIGEWSRVEEVTKQYEAYQKLVEPMCEYEFQYTDEVGELLVCRVHGNNSRHVDFIEENPHRPCLSIDPHEPPAPPVQESIPEEPVIDLAGSTALRSWLMRSRVKDERGNALIGLGCMIMLIPVLIFLFIMLFAVIVAMVESL